MKKQSEKLVAPDGGWGWMVCLGSGFIVLSLRSLDPSFGLLFGDLLKDLKVDTTGAAVIMSVLDTVLSFSGIFVGPLLKRFSCRKVSFYGSLLSCTGLILTSQANSITYIICTYSILGGLGTGLALTASFVSLNSYFKEKRTQVVGLYLAGASLGMMCMPQIVHVLLIQYDFRGTVLILGGLSLHAVVGSCLLQPVSYHLIPAPDKKDLKSVSNGAKDERDALLEAKENHEDKKLRKISIKSNAMEMSSIDVKKSHWKDDKTTQEFRTPDENGVKNDTDDKLTPNNSFVAKLVNFFDLNLLKDPIYLNILLGLSLSYEAELNFKLVMPFFLKSIGMSKADVAFSLSLTAFADVISRLTMPTVFSKFKFKNRNVFWISITLLGINRSVMAELMPGKILMAFLLFNGFLRGTTLANLNLTVAEHCTFAMLPSALGIMNVARGLCVATLGPLVGYIRDTTGSYQVSIHTMTGLMAISSVMWGIEYVIKKTRMRRNESDKESNHQVA